MKSLRFMEAEVSACAMVQEVSHQTVTALEAPIRSQAI
jgi:hypothetical protein